MDNLGKDTKGALLFGIMDTLPEDMKRREYNTMYTCPNCGRFFVVYHGTIECTCEAISKKNYWNE